MASVFLVGMATVDFVLSIDEFPAAADKYTAQDGRVVGGGCAANAAVAIARLGGGATLATRLGDDSLADTIVADLAAEGVRTEFIQQSPGARSSFSSVLLDRNGERQIVNFRGHKLTEETDWLENTPNVDATLVDTRWPAGAAAALDTAKQRQIPGIVDAEAPIDPAVLSRASHVAFSRQGLLALTSLTDLARALADVRQRLPGWACVTDGENGVYYTDGGQIAHVPAFKVQTRDTLAAGDIWHGAFALRLAEGAAETEAIKFANAAAALKCMNFGGRAGCPMRAEVDQFLKENS
ncbi:MAG: PfkB family carbohydrate kinase [Paracoccaceae bacterium]